MTKVHRIILLVVDHDDLGADGVKVEIENVRYPNHCISPRVLSVDTQEVEWTDDHPLNSRRTPLVAVRKLFGDPSK